MDSKGAVTRVIDELKNHLSPNLVYHGYQHTLDVLEAVEIIADKEQVGNSDKQLLLAAAAYHDCGFLRSNDQHEEMSCAIAQEWLPEYGFTKRQIEVVQEMIMATIIPQNPKNHLEQVLCDADLYYLGGDDYDKISRGLYEEILFHTNTMSESEWLEVQIEFLESQHYWTNHCINTRTKQKEDVLKRLKLQISTSK